MVHLRRFALATMMMAMVASGTQDATNYNCCSLKADYSVVPGSSWGTLTDDTKKSWWNANNCDNADFDSCGTQDATNYNCCSLKADYSVVPGSSWGTLTDDTKKSWWNANNCDNADFDSCGSASSSLVPVPLTMLEATSQAPYFIYARGMRACPEGTAITTAEMCRKAAALYGKGPGEGGGNTNWREWSSAEKPTGCSYYVDEGGKHVDFNNHAQGKADIYFTPICRSNLEMPASGPPVHKGFATVAWWNVTKWSALEAKQTPILCNPAKCSNPPECGIPDCRLVDSQQMLESACGPEVGSGCRFTNIRSLFSLPSNMDGCKLDSDLNKDLCLPKAVLWSGKVIAQWPKISNNESANNKSAPDTEACALAFPTSPALGESNNPEATRSMFQIVNLHPASRIAFCDGYGSIRTSYYTEVYPIPLGFGKAAGNCANLLCYNAWEKAAQGMWSFPQNWSVAVRRYIAWPFTHRYLDGENGEEWGRPLTDIVVHISRMSVCHPDKSFWVDGKKMTSTKCYSTKTAECLQTVQNGEPYHFIYPQCECPGGIQLCSCEEILRNYGGPEGATLKDWLSFDKCELGGMHQYLTHPDKLDNYCKFQESAVGPRQLSRAAYAIRFGNFRKCPESLNRKVVARIKQFLASV
jgi:hypothetical protein